MRRLALILTIVVAVQAATVAHAQSIRVTLAKQPFSPAGTSTGPETMADGGIREVSTHVNKVAGGPSSEELATLFEQIFARYPKAAAIGFATIPPSDPGGLSIAALNRMIVGAVKGVQQRAVPR